MNNLNAVVASPTESEHIEPYFSWRACENCGDTLGGNRYDIIYRKRLNGNIEKACVCETCFTELCG